MQDICQAIVPVLAQTPGDDLEHSPPVLQSRIVTQATANIGLMWAAAALGAPQSKGMSSAKSGPHSPLWHSRAQFTLLPAGTPSEGTKACLCRGRRYSFAELFHLA